MTNNFIHASSESYGNSGGRASTKDALWSSLIGCRCDLPCAKSGATGKALDSMDRAVWPSKATFTGPFPGRVVCLATFAMKFVPSGFGKQNFIGKVIGESAAWANAS